MARAVAALCALTLAAVAVPAARAASPNISVSRLPGPQAEATIAVDPSNDRILLAGSNSLAEGVMRVYSSTDGGITWASGTPYPAPASRRASCAGDPGVAIDADGRQYHSFLRATPCATGRPRLYVVSRLGPDAAWSRPTLVRPLGRSLFDDKPAIAVDASRASRFRNRVYVAWSRVSPSSAINIVLSHSDDGGRTWSRPVTVNETGREESYATIAVSRTGVVYVAWDDSSSFSLKAARSTDGGDHFEPERKVVSFSIVPIPHCGSGIPIRAQRLGCVHANPIVSVDHSTGPRAGTVYVSWAKTDFGGSHDVLVRAFDSRLRPRPASGSSAEGVRVTRTVRGERPDVFWPQSAVDPATGTVWVCFYDTTGDQRRERAFYSCSFSGDGGRTWAAPVRAASVGSDETQAGADGRGYGDYEGLVVANGVAHPIWTDSRDLDTLAEEIYTTRLTRADFRR